MPVDLPLIPYQTSQHLAKFEVFVADFFFMIQVFWDATLCLWVSVPTSELTQLRRNIK